MNPLQLSEFNLRLSPQSMDLLLFAANGLAAQASLLPALIQEQGSYQQLEAARLYAEKAEAEKTQAEPSLGDDGTGTFHPSFEDYQLEAEAAAQEAALQRSFHPAPAPQDEPVTSGETESPAQVLVPQPAQTAYLKSYHAAKNHLEWAEQCRRKEDGGFRVTPLSSEHPDDDYAAVGVLISTAMQHLDESIPNGQIDRTAHAYRALEYGAERLGAWLRKRNVIVA